MSMIIREFSGYYRFLSNFFPANVTFAGGVYPTVEHAFQASKTIDKDERWKIQRASTPAYAKALGRKVTLRPDWEVVKVDIMRALVRQKFENHSNLRRLLLSTGTKQLIHGNDHGDRFWGFCNRVGSGDNRLGEILMDVREEIRLAHARSN